MSEWNSYDNHRLPNGQIDSYPAHYTSEELKQIADTESFNYGKAGDESHTKLDIKHPKGDNKAEDYSKIRAKAMTEYRNAADYDKDGNYADIVKQEKDVRVWEKIPDSQKAHEYQKFLKWKRQNEPRKSISGISVISNLTD